MAAKKQYGLIISKKNAKPNPMIAKSSVFGEESSSDEEESRRRDVSASLRHEGIKKMQSKANREAMAEALEEDPTIYMYDEIYDQLQEKKKKNNPKLQEKKENKSRYIANLKRTSELRKIEQELAYERKVQKEREAEGEEFNDKESFLTGAYRKKLQERAEMEKRLKEEEEIEKRNDVTKQKDLGRMYRHLLDQKTTQNEDKQLKSAPEITTTEEKDKSNNEIPHPSERDTGTGIEPNEEEQLQQQEMLDIDQDQEELSPPEADITVSDNTVISSESLSNTAEKETKEERRKRLFAKRTSNDAALSAKERYLARKKAKLFQPTIANDDDD